MFLAAIATLFVYTQQTIPDTKGNMAPINLSESLSAFSGDLYEVIIKIFIFRFLYI